jgi:hypothetical protein
MGAFFRDYGTQFALAIAVLNTIISAIVGLQNNPISRFALVVASVALGGLAVGASFYSQHQIVASAEVEVQKRLAMKDLLHVAIGDNETLLAKQRTQSKDDVNAYLNEANTWTAKTGQLIEDAYGKGERDVFMNDAGINPINSVNNATALVSSELIARLQRLNELMSRVDTISKRPDFDPKTYQRNKRLCGAPLG